MLNLGGVHVTGKDGRRSLDRAFKLEAVRLVVEEGRKVAVVAREVAIRENMLRRWKQQIADGGSGAFPGKGHLRPDDEEVRRLRRDLLRVTEERDIPGLDPGCQRKQGQTKGARHE